MMVNSLKESFLLRLLIFLIQFTIAYSLLLSKNKGHKIQTRSILTYPARCGVSKISYRKSTVMYKWEVQGLIKYLDYVREFDETFVHETDHVKFTSPEDLNGLWKFKIHSSKTANDVIPKTLVNAKYTYEENPRNQRMNIGIKIKILHGPLYSLANEFIITKPNDRFIQKVKTITNLIIPPPKGSLGSAKSSTSSRRAVLPAWFSAATSSEEESDADVEDDNAAPDEKRNKGKDPVPKTEKYVEVNRVTVTFETRNIQPLLDSLRQAVTTQSEEDSAVDFTFIIDYYVPNDPIVTEQMKCYIGNFTHQLNSFGVQQQTQEFVQPNFVKQIVPSPTRFPSPVENKTQIKAGSEADRNAANIHDINRPPFVGNLENIFAGEEFSDMSILVQGQKIPAHRVLLAYSSPTLADMIRSSRNLGEFTLFDEKIGHNATKEILRYIYTGHANNLESEVDAVLIGAHQIGLAKLEQTCINFLMRDINIENALRIYSLAKDIDSDVLTKAAVGVIRQNRQAVVSQSKDFQRLAAKYPAIIFDLFLS